MFKDCQTEMWGNSQMKATDEQRQKMKEYYLSNKDKQKTKHKEYYENNKQKVLISRKRYYEENKEIIAKRQKLINEKRAYKDKSSSTEEEWKKYLSRGNSRKHPTKSSCEICKSNENLERHHWDYKRPLLVNTLCHECHAIQHIKHFNKSAYGGNPHF